MTAPSTNGVCPGCGLALRDAAMVGIEIIDGQTISYLLCSACAAVALADPKRMAAKLDLFFSATEGRA